MMTKASRQNVWLLVLLLAILSACSGGGGDRRAPDGPGEFVLRLDSQYLDWVDGPIPDAVGELNVWMPAATEREQDLIVGSEVAVDVSVSPLETFTTLYATVDSFASTAAGHYRADLAGEQSVVDLYIESPATLDQGAPYRLDVAIGAADGRISETRTLIMAAVEPGTTDLTVTLSWTNPTDLDLRLIEPTASNSTFGNFIDPVNGSSSVSGGGMVGRPFNHDSNGSCVIDGRNQESIIYEAVEPPVGIYVVSVVYSTDCGTGPENFTVTIQNDDQRDVYTGTVMQQGDVAEVAVFRRDPENR